MADQLIITGKYLGAGKTESFGENGFVKRKFWVDITTNAEYPDTPEFELTGDKVNLVDNLKAGQTVAVKFNLRGKRVFSKTLNKEIVINNVVAWKIDVITTQSAAVAPQRAAAPVAAVPTASHMPAGASAFSAEAGKDDLPF